MSAWNGIYEDSAVICPRCMGDGSVDCHCGGDLCVCDNYGERDCPVCYGEGEVSEDREARYMAAQREAHEAMRRAWAKPATAPETGSAGTKPGTGIVHTNSTGEPQ